ncbi:MAG: radical SAM protein [Candidatus Omnitrophota bacterium]
MKILLIVPRNKSLFGDKGMTAHPHIGIAYLSAYLRQNSVEAKVFDDGVEEDIGKLNQLIAQFKPDIIGITIFSYCYKRAYELVELIKAARIPIVAGGPHISAVGKKILLDTGIEFAVKQEGEYTLLELIKEMGETNPDFSQVRGLIWRNSLGEVIENPNREFIADLDSLPLPDYDSFGIGKYICYKEKMRPLITSRGCPFGCNYCSVRLSMGQNFRARSAQNVFKEIKYFYDRGVRNLDFNDDCFSLDKRRAEEICDLIIQNKLKIRFQLYNGIRVDTVDFSLLKKMREAGCYFVSYGCEAGNNKILKIINKGITLEQVRETVNLTNRVGIRNSVNFIVGHKEESYQDALDTLNFARSLPTDFVNFYNLLPYPGTEAFTWASEHAKFLIPLDSFLDAISYRDNKPVFETEEFTKEEREKVVALGFDLYRQRILVFRLGKIIGNIIYFITANTKINKSLTHFALNNPFGRAIYIMLSHRSFKPREENV